MRNRTKYFPKRTWTCQLWGYSWIPMTLSKPLIDTEICKSWQEQWKRSSTTFERMLVTFSSVFQLFILYANFCYFTRTLKNDLGRWKNFVVFITDFYYTIYIKENLKKKIEKNEKTIFPRAKLQHTAAFTQFSIGLESEVKGVIDLVCGKAYYFEGNHG